MLGHGDEGSDDAAGAGEGADVGDVGDRGAGSVAAKAVPRRAACGDGVGVGRSRDGGGVEVEKAKRWLEDVEAMAMARAMLR